MTVLVLRIEIQSYDRYTINSIIENNTYSNQKVISAVIEESYEYLVEQVNNKDDEND